MTNRPRLLRRAGIVSLVAASLALGACETRPTTYAFPTNPNITFGQFEGDKAYCEQWARSQYGTSQGQRAIEHGAQGAVGGAAVGALLGGIFGGWRGAGLGAMGGGTLGAGAGVMSGTVSGQDNFNRAYATCMQAKGHNVR